MLRHVLVVLVLGLALVGCGNPRHVVASPRIDAPPPGKALMNFVYDYGTQKEQAIHDEQKHLLFLVAPRTVHQLVTDPGTHDYYIASYYGGVILARPGIDSMIRINAAAGRIYDVNITVDFANITRAEPAHPGTSHHADVVALTKTLQPVGPVDRTIPDIHERELKFGPRLDQGVADIHRDPNNILHEMKPDDSRDR